MPQLRDDRIAVVDPNLPPELPPAPSWSRDVPCIGRWDEFDNPATSPARARSMCADCPMIDRCRQEAAVIETIPLEVAGVRGGLSARERMVALISNKRERCGNGHKMNYMDPKSVRIAPTSGSVSCCKCQALEQKRRQTMAAKGTSRARRGEAA